MAKSLRGDVDIEAGEGSDCGEFIMRLMHSRTNAHIQHLSTKSYAEHVALQGYYEGIVDLIDSFVESYQGKYGIEKGYPSSYVMETDSKSMLTKLRAYVAAERNEITDETDLQNIIDEMISLIDGTLYKLRFLS